MYLQVDELHLIGEPGRGGTLETLLSTVIFANSKFMYCYYWLVYYLSNVISVVTLRQCN